MHYFIFLFGIGQTRLRHGRWREKNWNVGFGYVERWIESSTTRNSNSNGFWRYRNQSERVGRHQWQMRSSNDRFFEQIKRFFFLFSFSVWIKFSRLSNWRDLFSLVYLSQLKKCCLATSQCRVLKKSDAKSNERDDRIMTTITQQESSMISSPGVKHYPLVHVLTSKTENELEKDQNEPFNFEKTIKFLNDPHSVKSKFSIRKSSNDVFFRHIWSIDEFVFVKNLFVTLRMVTFSKIYHFSFKFLTRWSISVNNNRIIST